MVYFFIKVFAISFLLVLIFRKSNDENDQDYDPNDIGEPIYFDERINKKKV